MKVIHDNQISKFSIAGNSFNSPFLSSLSSLEASYRGADAEIERNIENLKQSYKGDMLKEKIQAAETIRQENRKELEETLDKLQSDTLFKLEESRKQEVARKSMDIQNAIQLINSSGKYMTADELNIISDKYRNYSVVQRALREFVKDSGASGVRLYPTNEDIETVINEAVQEARKSLLYRDKMHWGILEGVSFPVWEAVLVRNELLKDNLDLKHSETTAPPKAGSKEQYPGMAISAFSQTI